MNASSNDNAGPTYQPPPAAFAQPADAAPAATPPRDDRDASAAATDWQIILHLKTLFTRDPELVSALLDDPDPQKPEGYRATLMAAAREALATCPRSAGLHYHLARAEALAGKAETAANLLEQAVALDPSHVAAATLLENIRADCRQPIRPAIAPHRSFASGASPAMAPEPGKHDRRGNELPS